MDASADAVQGRTGLIYRHVGLYRLAMWLLYKGRRGRERQLVVEAIPPGSSVVDLCCGDCSIAPPLLARNCRYRGLDINPAFLAYAAGRGLDARYWDGDVREIPEADVICMLSSLYQFIPDQQRVFAEMVMRARRRVIVAEPVRNWATSSFSPLRRLAEALTRVNGRTFPERLSEHDLLALADRIDRDHVSVTRLRREVVLVVDVQHEASAAGDP